MGARHLASGRRAGPPKRNAVHAVSVHSAPAVLPASHAWSDLTNPASPSQAAAVPTGQATAPAACPPAGPQAVRRQVPAEPLHVQAVAGAKGCAADCHAFRAVRHQSFLPTSDQGQAWGVCPVLIHPCCCWGIAINANEPANTTSPAPAPEAGTLPGTCASWLEATSAAVGAGVCYTPADPGLRVAGLAGTLHAVVYFGPCSSRDPFKPGDAHETQSGLSVAQRLLLSLRVWQDLLITHSTRPQMLICPHDSTLP